jgi:hypothetical protein
MIFTSLGPHTHLLPQRRGVRSTLDSRWAEGAFCLSGYLSVGGWTKVQWRQVDVVEYAPLLWKRLLTFLRCSSFSLHSYQWALLRSSRMTSAPNPGLSNFPFGDILEKYPQWWSTWNRIVLFYSNVNFYIKYSQSGMHPHCLLFSTWPSGRDLMHSMEDERLCADSN